MDNLKSDYPVDMLDKVGSAAKDFNLKWPVPNEMMANDIQGMLAWSERTVNFRAKFFTQIDKHLSGELQSDDLAASRSKLNMSDVSDVEESLRQFYYRFMSVIEEPLDKRDTAKGYGRSFDEIRIESLSDLPMNGTTEMIQTLTKVKSLELLEEPYLGLVKAMENYVFVKGVISAAADQEIGRIRSTQ